MMPHTADFRATYGASLAFLAGRDELPILLNQRRLLGCGVEVGVQEGLYSEHLLTHWMGKHLISVDPWIEDAPDAYLDIANVPQAEHDSRYEATGTRLAGFGSRSSIWRLTSLEGAARVPNYSLDFVYIDARHDFDSVTEDLEAWFEKVRPGGIIAGHDYLDDDGPCGNFRVKSAVDTFFARHGLTVHATFLDKPWLTWIVEAPIPSVQADSATALPGATSAELGSPHNGNGAARGVANGNHVSATNGNGTAPTTIAAAPGIDGAAATVSATKPNGQGNGQGRGHVNGSADLHPGGAATVETARSGAREVKLNLALAAGPREFRLRLNDRHLSQRMMLEYFDIQQLYEPETSKLIVTVLRPGDTFIDVGSHIGYFSMLAATLVGPGGSVVAFEPDTDNFRQLQGHIELNGYRNIAPINAAVGERSGYVEFHVNADNDGGHALWNVGDHPFNERSRQLPNTRQIEMVSLDAVLDGADIPRPRVLKIDVEGAEHSVLLGAVETLTKGPVDFVIAEINRYALERMGTTEAALRTFMTDLGYETYAFDPDGESLIRIGAGETIQSDYVFNLVFRHPAAAA